MIKTILIDDEPLARSIVLEYLQGYPEIEVVQECNDGFEGVKAIGTHKPDLVFLDIQMPKINGFEMLELIESPPAVIFTTAFDEYAIKAFESHAIDYLLKPFSFDRFAKAVKKAEELLSLKHEKVQREDDYIFIKSDQRLLKVNYNDILFVEALADYVKIHTDDKRYITLQTMKNMEEKLPERFFKRVHRSYIVSLEKIKTIVGSNVEINGQQIPIGKNYKDGFFDALRKHNILK